MSASDALPPHVDRLAAKDTLTVAPKRGRPPTFDEAKQHEFCSLLSLGCTISKAAATVGISRRTVLYAARRDPSLADRIRLSRLESHLDPLNKIANSKSWRAAAWLLERRSRDFRLPRKRSRGTGVPPVL
jgi:hypothetical protein